MTEKYISLASEQGTPTREDCIEGYLALNDEERDQINERAFYLRNGPTGMNFAEALLAAMQEKMSQDLEQS